MVVPGGTSPVFEILPNPMAPPLTEGLLAILLDASLDEIIPVVFFSHH